MSLRPALGTDLHLLASHLLGLGIGARVMDRKESGQPPRGGFFDWDPGWIAIDGLPLDFATVRRQGRLPMTLDNLSAAKEWKGFRVPLRSVRPIQIHFVVRRDPKPFPPHFNVDLVAETEGRAEAKLVRLRWEGGRLARRLAGDDELLVQLTRALAPFERIRIKAQPKQRQIRIVLMSRVVGGATTWMQGGVERETGYPNAGLFDAMCAVGRHVREAKPGL